MVFSDFHGTPIGKVRRIYPYEPFEGDVGAQASALKPNGSVHNSFLGEQKLLRSLRIDAPNAPHEIQHTTKSWHLEEQSLEVVNG